jgi:hypothetical protein
MGGGGAVAGSGGRRGWSLEGGAVTGGRIIATAWLQGDDALPTSHHDPKHNISIKPWRMGCARPWNGKYFRTSRGAAVAILKRDSNVQNLQIRFRFTGHHGHGWVRWLRNNKRWVASMKRADPLFFERLAKGQSPARTCPGSRFTDQAHPMHCINSLMYYAHPSRFVPRQDSCLRGDCGVQSSHPVLSLPCMMSSKPTAVGCLVQWESTPHPHATVPAVLVCVCVYVCVSCCFGWQTSGLAAPTAGCLPTKSWAWGRGRCLYTATARTLFSTRI